MPDASMNGIISAYVEEVRDYIPRLTQGVQLLQKNTAVPETLISLKDMVHTLQNASLLLGFTGMCNIAQEMEKAIVDLQADRLSLDEKTCSVLMGTVQVLETYCSGLIGEGVRTRDLARETALSYRRLRGASEAEDEAAISPVLEGLPEWEGGGFCANGNGDIPLSELSEMDEEEPPIPPSGPPVFFPGPVALPDVPKELLDGFHEESKEHLENLDGDLLLLERETPGPMDMTPAHKEIIRRIRRSVHTLKGASAVIGFTAISAWGHALEDFLDWLYESVHRIGPETTALLTESCDLLAKIVSDPAHPENERASELSAKFHMMIGNAPPEEGPSEETVVGPLIPDTCEVDFFSSKSQTVRVDTQRVDEMVNLIGEVMIVQGAFDQQLRIFMDTLGELDLFRNRLRDIAREMEIGYEVKALGRMAGGRTDEISSEFKDFDELELDRYSRLHVIIRTLNESVIDIGALNSRFSGLHGELDTHMNRQQILIREIQDKMMSVRMLPFDTLSSKFRRTVREVGKTLGKNVRLIISGEGIELDRLILERITDPLMHLLRNAVDHGIESPEIRARLEKPKAGTIRIDARYDGNQVVIRLSDDGGGLDYEKIRKKAVKFGVIQEGDLLSEEDLAALIFRPGFSTRDTISEVSGRGVGMDVVRENVRALKGAVHVAAAASRGSVFTLSIPLTLVAVRALLFNIGGRIFAVSLSDVQEILRAGPDLLTTDPEPAVRYGEDWLPIFSLNHVLGVPNSPDEQEAGGRDQKTEHYPLCLVVKSAGRLRAIRIDRLVGQREIVIKNTGSHLRTVKGVDGVTILGDGSLIPILNIAELIETDAAFFRGSAESYPDKPVEDSPLKLLVVDDSVSIRQVVSKLIEDQGWRVQTAKDGADALEKLESYRPDAILLDIEMPRMNGYELLSVIGRDSRLKPIPVVMLTSRVTEKHRKKALALGARGFMGKPFKNDEFIDMVLTVTGKSG